MQGLKKNSFQVLSALVVAALLVFAFQNCGDGFKTIVESELASQSLSCELDQHLEGDLCVANKRSCSVLNGMGEQNWNDSGWGTCTLTQCNQGFEKIGTTCRKQMTFLSTQGNQIIDGEGKKIRIAAVNWKGMETVDYAPIGLYAQPWRFRMDGIKAAGFNTIRLPFSLELLETMAMPKNIDFQKNPELVGKTPLQIMDMIIAYAHELGLRVILDCHRRTADELRVGSERDGVWYDSYYTEQKWISAWVFLANRYKNNPTVIGADLFNEPHSTATNLITWGGGGANDWARAAEAAASAILTEHPSWLIFVEGHSGYNLTGLTPSTRAWWGQNLQGVRNRPIRPVVQGKVITNKVVYSAHPYPPGVLQGPNELFNASNFPQNMPAVWNQMFGYIYTSNIAPLWIGEFNANQTGVSTNSKCTLNDAREPKWINAFLKYLGGDFNGDGTSDIRSGDHGMSWAYWQWGFDDCGRNLFLDVKMANLDTAKINLLRPLMFPQY